MKILTLILAVLITTGCTGMKVNPYTGLSNTEIVWQSMHAIDTAQTLSIAKDPCYFEDNWLGKNVISTTPTETEVLVWSVVQSYGHAQFSQWLNRTDTVSEKTKTLIKILDFGVKFSAIQGNYAIGLNFSTSDNDVDYLCRTTR